MSSANTVTFGIELEFVLQLSRSQMEGHRSKHDAGCRVLAETLERKTNLPIASLCRHSPNLSCSICQDANPALKGDHFRIFGAMPTHDPRMNPFSQYYLTKNETVPLLGIRFSENDECVGMELTTPIRGLQEVTAGCPEIMSVLRTLRDSKKLKVGANTSCGYHIHVGVGGGMMTDQAKKLISLMMMIEQVLIVPLCGTRRQESSFARPIMESCRFSRGDVSAEYRAFDVEDATNAVSLYFPFVKPQWTGSGGAQIRPAKWNNRDPAAFCDILRLVWQAPDMTNLAYHLAKTINSAKAALHLALRHEDGSAFRGFHSEDMNKDFEGTPSTFEWRYPQIGFDPTYVRAWIELTTRLMQVATFRQPQYTEKIMQIFEALQADAATGTGSSRSRGDVREKILTVLGLGHQIAFWRSQWGMYSRGKEIDHLDKYGVLKKP